MNKPIIKVNHLVKRYKKAKENAVDDLTFDVKEGEFFALLGPNGAGKTTTISILTTTLAPTSGKVTLAGYDIEKESAKVRGTTGIIFQKPSLDENLTAEENVRFHCILYGIYSYRPTYSLMPQEYKDRLDILAKVVGIEKEFFKPVKTFSGGMKRKLEIVRSLMHKPKILFLDEPTSGLDPLSRKSLWQYLMHVRKTENTTVFLTTHYLEEAEDADRVCVINHGKIVALGTPDELKNKWVHELLLVDAKDRKKLKKELDSLNMKYKEDGCIEIQMKDENAQKVIQSIKTPLTYLHINNPTLEEAYLEIVGYNKTEEKADTEINSA
jgi:ABC-2 type transport system ATP-binding protein